jgi:hypothetical protein
MEKLDEASIDSHQKNPLSRHYTYGQCLDFKFSYISIYLINQLQRLIFLKFW